MDEQKNEQLRNTLAEINEQDSVQTCAEQETAAEKRGHYMTEQERREWSGVSEWQDPLKKERPQPDVNDGRLAMASLLCGIVSVLIACIHISSVLFGTAAIVCGIISRKKGENAYTLSKIGIILGCVCLGLALCRDILWVLGRLFPPEPVCAPFICM